MITVPILPTVLARPDSAAVTSYGETVRVVGMSWDGFWAAVPSGSTARYFSPSSVRIRIAAVLVSPCCCRR